MQTILVIDDEWLIVELLCQILEEEGYTTRSAANGREGLILLRAALPDLIICDIMMPGLSGVDFCHALRADPHAAEVPLILMSAANLPPDAHSCDFSAFLQKPILLETLLGLVQMLLANS